MRYTLRDFQKEYLDDNSCLDAVFQERYEFTKQCSKCHKPFKYYRVKGRQCYACAWCAHQVFPLADTIFRRTTTPLSSWFYAIYLFSTHKNGVSAPTLQAELGVTYKTAWRMCRLIRLLMAEEGKLGSGPVEADEMQYGKRKKDWKRQHATTVYGAVERGGHMRTQVSSWPTTKQSMSFLRAHIESGIELYTDGSTIYTWADKEYKHSAVNHSKKQWTKGDAHINTIEGIFSYIQGAITGTYRGVSPKYLQHYLNEYTYRYNHKGEVICRNLLERAARPV